VLALIRDSSVMCGIDGFWIAAHLQLMIGYVAINRSSRWLMELGLKGDASI